MTIVYISSRQINLVLDVLHDGEWHVSREITQTTGLRGLYIRRISATTGKMISSVHGYKLLQYATHAEYSKFMNNMENRIKGIELHMENTQANWNAMEMQNVAMMAEQHEGETWPDDRR